MGTITRLIKNHSRINIAELVKEAVEDNKEDLVLSQLQQMIEGRTATGKKIGKYKNKKYKQKKFDLNPLAGYGNVDLKLQGYFHKGVKVFFFSTSFFFKSTDWKNDILTEKYGEDIWGLMPKKIKYISIKKVKPLVIKRILQKTFI